MKYFLYCVVTLCSILPLHAEDKLEPLFMEDRHFIYYRSLMIASAVQRIEDALDASGICDEVLLYLINAELDVIKYNLGEFYLGENDSILVHLDSDDWD